MLGRTNTGGGSSPLNFKVVGGTSAPSNPKENTIWVNTDVPITSWIFSATEPEAPAEGMVWFTTGTASNVEFNALKKNGIQIYPMTSKQRVSGAWVSKSALSYQGGVWADWFLYLYKDGTIYGDIVGGLNAYAYRPSTSGADAIKPDVSMTASGITLSLKHGANGSAGALFATRGIDVTKYRTVKLHVDNAKISDYDGYIRFGVTDTRANNYVVTAAQTILNKVGNVSGKTFSLDISSLTGNYYFFINMYSNGDKTVTFSRWWLEP